MPATLYYIHDPMCSWCWGYRPMWQQLRTHLPANVAVVNILGGLAADTDQPMPLDMQENLQQVWRTVQQKLGSEFNFNFWTKNKPRRATYPACRAVLAAAQQGREDAMIAAIQQAYYLRALNPSVIEILQQLAQELGLDCQQFTDDMCSDRIEIELQKQINLARSWPIAGFPSLVLKVDDRLLPIRLDYLNYRVSLADVTMHLY